MKRLALLLPAAGIGWGAGPTFNIRDYGAPGDGSAPATDEGLRFIGSRMWTNGNVHHAQGAVTIGSETSGGVRNVVASNITCGGIQMGVRIKSRRGRSGGDVRLDNSTMENVGTAINVTGYYLMEGEKPGTAPEPVSVRTPVFRNIAASNMTVNHARVAVARKPPAGMPVIRRDHGPGAIVRNSRAAAGTGTFLSAGNGELKTVALEGNVLDGVRTAVEESARGFAMAPESPTEKP